MSIFQQFGTLYINYCYWWQLQRFCDFVKRFFVTLCLFFSSFIFRKCGDEVKRRRDGVDTNVMWWENGKMLKTSRIESVFASIFPTARSQEFAIAPQSLSKRFGFHAKAPLTHLRWPLSFFSFSVPFSLPILSVNVYRNIMRMIV